MTGWQIWHSDGLQTIAKSVRLTSQNAWPNTTDCWKSNHHTIEVSVPQIHLAVDVATRHFYKEAKYELDGVSLTGQEMIQTLNEWASRFPLVSIEDGLHEEAWEFWPELTQALDNLCLTLGDDFLCTNPGRIRRAVKSSACNALLLKLNQVGTLSEGAEACRLAREAGWKVVVSARSGETEDDWLADLAFGWAADYIKVGSITQSERLAKYNRRLEIESSYD